MSGTDGIVVESVSKAFSGVQALEKVDLRLIPAGILGLIGPNGSGKTTLLNCISGLLRPTAGRIVIDGAQSSGLPADRVARLGVSRTFQNIRLFQGLTVRENVEIGVSSAIGWRRAKGNRARVARELLDDLGIAEVEQRAPATLSYGVQRRVEIARALATFPKYLLLDEPAAGMNERESDHLLQFISKIHEDRHCAVLIVDHDLRLIMRLCHRIQVLNEGRVIAEGEPATIRQDPAVISAYLGAAPTGDQPRTEQSPRGDSQGQRT